MEYFTLFAWCYTAYRGVVLAFRLSKWCYVKVRDTRCTVIDDCCADEIGFHAIHDVRCHNVREPISAGSADWAPVRCW